ncbi:hypothetical protein OE88DRAFT_926352 [Heliocybe sulcata]|uniref:Uncharacterized protein n=1 Tax=Heliocybe sulcata TaxID=5364 RepID=A0A5C3MNE9_9AGAM|nr:hypothetical protein OE88DRAFT_926352 [Heliocybe sulcata]
MPPSVASAMSPKGADDTAVGFVGNVVNHQSEQPTKVCVKCCYYPVYLGDGQKTCARCKEVDMGNAYQLAGRSKTARYVAILPASDKNGATKAIFEPGERTKTCMHCPLNNIPVSDGNKICAMSRTSTGPVAGPSKDGTKTCTRCKHRSIPTPDWHKTCATCREGRSQARKRRVAAAAALMSRTGREALPEPSTSVRFAAGAPDDDMAPRPVAPRPVGDMRPCPQCCRPVPVSGPWKHCAECLERQRECTRRSISRKAARAVSSESNRGSTAHTDKIGAALPQALQSVGPSKAKSLRTESASEPTKKSDIKPNCCRCNVPFSDSRSTCTRCWESASTSSLKRSEDSPAASCATADTACDLYSINTHDALSISSKSIGSAAVGVAYVQSGIREPVDETKSCVERRPTITTQLPELHQIHPPCSDGSQGRHKRQWDDTRMSGSTDSECVKRRRQQGKPGGAATASIVTSNEERRSDTIGIAGAYDTAARRDERFAEQVQAWRNENLNIRRNEVRKDRQEVTYERTNRHVPLPLAERSVIQNEVEDRTQESDSQTKTSKAKTAEAVKPTAQLMHQGRSSLPAEAWRIATLVVPFSADVASNIGTSAGPETPTLRYKWYSCDPAIADRVRSEMYARSSVLPIKSKEEPHTEKAAKESVAQSRFGEENQQAVSTLARADGACKRDQTSSETVEVLVLRLKLVKCGFPESVVVGGSIDHERFVAKNQAADRKQRVVPAQAEDEDALTSDKTSSEVDEALLLLFEKPVVSNEANPAIAGPSGDHEWRARKNLKRQ